MNDILKIRSDLSQLLGYCEGVIFSCYLIEQKPLCKKEFKEIHEKIKNQTDKIFKEWKI